jgi:hypothetical protein
VCTIVTRKKRTANRQAAGTATGIFGKSLVSLLLFVFAEAAVAVVLLDIVPMVMRNGNCPKAKRSESEMNTQSGRRRLASRRGLKKMQQRPSVNSGTFLMFISPGFF